MAKNRYLNTKFWVDSYITTLDRDGKLLFLYFLTNQLTSICGIYEISIRQISFDTRLDETEVNMLLQRFETDKKIAYLNGWVFIKNFIKYQIQNDSVKKGVCNALAEVPQEIMAMIRQKLTEWGDSGSSVLTLCDLSELEFESEFRSEFKLKDAAPLKQKFWENPVMRELQAKYPNRDYDHEFSLMVDWWKNNKRKLPKSISAFANWLAKSKPDPEILSEKDRQWEKEKTKVYTAPRIPGRDDLVKKLSMQK